jgi:ABC-type Fe3+ transport system substrate-binding protein
LRGTAYALVAAVVVGLAACQPTNAPPGQPTSVGRASTGQSATQPEAAAGSTEVARVLAAARSRNENELNLSWSGNTLGGTEGAKEFESLFNQMYGLTIKVNFTPGPSMTEMAGKVTQEAAAGRAASTDLLLGSETHYAALLERDVMESYDYGTLSARANEGMLAPKNIGVEISSRIPGITYNTKLVPPADVPKRLADVLDPKWKGRIASTVNAASLDRVALVGDWTTDKMRSFALQLTQQVGGLIRCGESTRIISGEFAMLAMDCGSYEARKQQARGAPLGHVIPEDAAHVVFWYMGVPRNSANPNLAKLFIGMVLSPEGQKIVYSQDATDLYSLSGSQSATELADLKAKGVSPTQIDVQFLLAHPGTIEFTDELIKILRQKSGS